MKNLREDTIAEEDYTIVDYGWDDRLKGKLKRDNPYPNNNWKYYDWLEGWDLADKSAGLDD